MKDLTPSLTPSSLQDDIDALLHKINQQMSTYSYESEISRFNRYRGRDWFPISSEFFYVTSQAIKAHHISQAAFEPTLYPLVDLWGFAKSAHFSPPSDHLIKKALQHIGLQHLKTRSISPALAKQDVLLSLDFSAIAKGYAVDQVSALLKARGLYNHLVEIGGEIQAQGHNAQQQDWHIAVEHPDNVHTAQIPITSLYLHNQALATSGNYRNFFEYKGKRYAHTLDPKTGKPTQHSLVSVTVVHESSLWADAMATAIMVMGAKKGLAFANQQKLAVFMVTSSDGKHYQSQWSKRGQVFHYRSKAAIMKDLVS
jgi:thiamine biosynthesis lipoprotein